MYDFVEGWNMNLFETLMVNVIFITFPLLFCLLYQSYNETLNKEKNELFLDIALVSSFYLMIRFGLNISDYKPLLLLNIPLMIAYIKDRKMDIILLSIGSIIYYVHYLKFSLPLVIFEYILYYGMNLLYQQKKWNPHAFVHILITIKCIFVTILLYLSVGFRITDLFSHAVIVVSFFLIAEFTLYLLERAEEILQLRVRLKEFEHEKEIRESLFKITHEIKNPIAVCKGYLDMFDVNQLEHSQKYIPILKEEIERVLILLEDFLSINKIHIEKDVMDVNLLLESIHHNFIPILEEHHIDAHFDMCDDELLMLGDYNRISQVLINLIKNSIEAIGEKQTGMITVSVIEDEQYLKIAVQDNGKGMSKEELTQIKKPFFTTKQKGTGLGVYLSDEIIREHQGTIQYKSKEGEGTTVTLTFPRKQSDFDIR